MSDYTPTTDDIRRAHRSPRYGLSIAEVDARFDRWLATVAPNPDDAAQVEVVVRALANNWRNAHTNESLGRQRMLARAVLTELAKAARHE